MIDNKPVPRGNNLALAFLVVGTVVAGFLLAIFSAPLNGVKKTSYRSAVTPFSAVALSDHPSHVRSVGNDSKASPDNSRAVNTVNVDSMDLGKPSGLDRPGALSVAEFEKQLFPFLQSRKYVELGWKTDKSIRDTGPFVDGSYYGTHPAVRVFYSPEIIKWLADGRIGTIPDGAMMIKEQYPPPAVRYEGQSDEELRGLLESWTVMVKDSKASHDGWFWSNPVADPKVVDNHQYPFDHPVSGVGHYCVRCHASTQSPNVESPESRNEFTFAALRNIEGFAGEPIIFRVDDSWRETENESSDTNEAEPSEGDSEAKAADSIANDSEKSPIVSADTNTIAKKFHRYGRGSHPSCTNLDRPELCISEPSNAFIKYFDAVTPIKREDVLRIPPITHDWIVQNADRSRDFLTSNQCMGCHSGLTKPYGPSMFVPIGESAEYGEPGWNVSPFGEWRWTPMGLAGRDPVFYAQMESEIARLKQEFKPEDSIEIADALVDTCMRCHGAMGKHQFDLDHSLANTARQSSLTSQLGSSPVAPKKQLVANGNDSKSNQRPTFSLQNIYAVTDSGKTDGQSNAQLGSLARDGVSCMVCHRMQPRVQPEDDDRPYLKFFLETSITGNAHFGKDNEIYGPFKDDDIKPFVMQHGTGIKPMHSDYLKSSQLCATCHTVSLPAVDNPLVGSTTDPNAHAGHIDEDDTELIDGENVELFKKFHHHIEQATYLEWLNSEFENEFNKSNPKAQTCQDCHMSSGLSDPDNGIDLKSISTRIAAVQDSTYPDAENLTNHDNLKIAIREDGYRRHNFSGLNVFLVEMFNQHDDLLGVRKFDFMTGSKLDIEHAIKNFVQTARQKTADVSVETTMAPADSPNKLKLIANVLVKNKAGHKFPSGVGFRRAFLELSVSETTSQGQSKVIWASGRTNELGVLTGADGKPLPEEMFETNSAGKQVFHPHHQVIRSQNQVQVYETLLLDNSGKFTTSFIHGCVRFKDNRFLPRGWTKEGPDAQALSGKYLQATHPGPLSEVDPQYRDGSGTDQVKYEITLPGDLDISKLTVEAKLYYQAIPPYYLNNLFKSDPDGPAIKRLHFLCSNLDLSDTVIKDWKLLIQSASTEIQ